MGLSFKRKVYVFLPLVLIILGGIVYAYINISNHYRKINTMKRINKELKYIINPSKHEYSTVKPAIENDTARANVDMLNTLFYFILMMEMKMDPARMMYGVLIRHVYNFDRHSYLPSVNRLIDYLNNAVSYIDTVDLNKDKLDVSENYLEKIKNVDTYKSIFFGSSYAVYVENIPDFNSAQAYRMFNRAVNEVVSRWHIERKWILDKQIMYVYGYSIPEMNSAQMYKFCEDYPGIYLSYVGLYNLISYEGEDELFLKGAKLCKAHFPDSVLADIFFTTYLFKKAKYAGLLMSEEEKMLVRESRLRFFYWPFINLAEYYSNVDFSLQGIERKKTLKKALEYYDYVLNSQLLIDDRLRAKFENKYNTIKRILR